MSTVDVALVARLERQIHELERRHRTRTRAIVVGCSLLATFGLLTAWTPSSGPGVVASRLALLEREVATLREMSMSSKVVEPFEVVDRGGKPMLRVSRTSDGGTALVMRNAATEVVWISAIGTGGFLKTRSSSTFPEVVVGSAGGFGGLTVRDGDLKSRLTAGVSGGLPSVEIANDNHVVVANLRQGSTGGGHIELGDATGNAQVRAGITSGGCGRVETYPERPVRATALGVPGDKILGHCP